MTARWVCRPPANRIVRSAVASSTLASRAVCRLGGSKDDGQNGKRRLGDHRARRIRRGVPERPGLVGEREATGDVDDVFADAWIAFALLADPQHDRRLKRQDVIETVRQLELERAPIADVHERVDARKVVALPDTAQQRLRGRTRLGGIEADAAVHGAHRLALLGRMRPHGVLGRRQRRFQSRVGHGVGRLLDDERAEPDDCGQPGRYDNLHLVRPCRLSSASRSCR